MCKKSEPLTGAEAALAALGRCGRWHLAQYLALALPVLVAAPYALNYVFLAADVPYRCAVPECEGNVREWAPDWATAALPPGERRRCWRFAPVSAPATPACSPAAFSKELVPCDAWVYANNDTIVAEFDLACQEWRRALVGSVHNVAMLLSLPLFGYISDRWGRKPALVLSCVGVGAVGTLKAFSRSYLQYISIEFLETLPGASTFPAAYIMTVELLGHDKRVVATALHGTVLVLGGVGFALLARTFTYWRSFILVAYPPSLLFLLYMVLLPESVRWLLLKGRTEEAAQILTRAAKMNGVTLSDETMRQIAEVKSEEKSEEGVWRAVAASRVLLRRLGVCAWWWISCALVYYGLAIGSVSLAGDKYLNFMLVASADLLATAANTLLLDRVGRKPTLFAAYTFCGLACLAAIFVPHSWEWSQRALHVAAKVGVTQAFQAVYLFTAELFPTQARHSLLACCSMLGRLGSIAAPQMPLLAAHVWWLPQAVFAGAVLAAAALTTLTPETLHKPLPDTIADAEALAKRSSHGKRATSTTEKGRDEKEMPL